MFVCLSREEWEGGRKGKREDRERMEVYENLWIFCGGRLGVCNCYSSVLVAYDWEVGTGSWVDHCLWVLKVVGSLLLM